MRQTKHKFRDKNRLANYFNCRLTLPYCLKAPLTRTLVMCQFSAITLLPQSKQKILSAFPYTPTRFRLTTTLDCPDSKLTLVETMLPNSQVCVKNDFITLQCRELNNVAKKNYPKVVNVATNAAKVCLIYAVRHFTRAHSSPSTHTEDPRGGGTRGLSERGAKEG